MKHKKTLPLGAGVVGQNAGMVELGDEACAGGGALLSEAVRDAIF